MARFSSRDAKGLRDLAGDLGTIREGAPPALSWLVGGLRDVLDSNRAAACVYAPRGEGLSLPWGYTAKLSHGLIVETDRFLADKTVGWTAFNPLRPEPQQRNVALTLCEVKELSGVKTASILTNVYARFGLLADDQLRVLICEGSSLLAWIGLFQSAPFDPRQKRILSHLIAPIRRRLSAERLLQQAPSTRALLDAALECVPAPAFVFDADGILLEANTAGGLWLDTHGATGREILRRALRGRAPANQFRVTDVTVASAVTRRLVVFKGDGASAHAWRTATVAWRFSKRETELFALLSRGLTNRAIAAELAIAERTVETHLTSMFEKAQVETRAELVVRAMQPFA
ncbi:MAG: Transcriptional regulator, LuxR family [Labilithrix sp.]|nr:Transcriptional regulator, LuxR family [Labilithrix sp.]